jgi:hypothetical protein
MRLEILQLIFSWRAVDKAAQQLAQRFEFEQISAEVLQKLSR